MQQIRTFLKSKQWETRVASAKTISCICEGVPHATVADIARLEGVTAEQAAATAAAARTLASSSATAAAADTAADLTFDGFDIVGVLERAAPLLSAKVGDFDASTVDDAKLSKAERLKRAKQSLRQRLGLALQEDGATGEGDGAGSGGKGGTGGDGGGMAATGGLDVSKFVDVDELVGEDDIEVEVKTEKGAGAVGGGGVAEVGVKAEAQPAKVDATDIGQLSARERNRLKRKQKRSARDVEEGIGPAAKRARGGDGGDGGGGGGTAIDAEAIAAEAAEEEEEAAEVEAGGWPLSRTCESLAYSLFAPRWEERHGAAAALREVLRHHAAAAAVVKPPPRAAALAPLSAAAAAKSNAAWLEDMAVRLLCLLSLDRFGDYVGDGVVAPVRETGAQALGAALLPLPPAAVEAVVRAVLALLQRKEW